MIMEIVEREFIWDTQMIEGYWSMVRRLERLCPNLTLPFCSIVLGLKLGTTVTDIMYI